MAKNKKTFVCRDCGGVQPKWIGRCPDCGAWDTLESFTVEASPVELAVSGTAGGASWHPAGSDQAGGGAVRIDQVESLEVPRREIGLSEFDRVLGGGLVSGAAILLGGEPGVGKSTLLLQAAARLAAGGTRILYVSS